MITNNRIELNKTIPRSTHIQSPSSAKGMWPRAVHTTPSTRVRRNTLEPTVLATSTPAWALRPDLNATSFSGRVVAIERMVRPAVDCVMCKRSASEDVVEDSKIPESVRRAADSMSLMI